MFESIRIQNFKSIRDTGELELRPINIFIGANGAGKSNFISFFKFLKKCSNYEVPYFVKQNGGADSLLFYGKRGSNNTLKATVKFNNKHKSIYSFEMISNIYDELLFSRERIEYNDEQGNRNIIDTNELKYHLFQYHPSILHDTRILNHGIDFSHINIYHFHDTGFHSSMKSSSEVNDSVFLYEDGSNLASILYKIKNNSDERYYNTIKNIIRSIIPFFKDFHLQPEENGRIYLKWSECCNEKLFNAHHLSDGTLRMIALTVLFNQPQLPPIIIIDEPELGLHPAAIHKLAGLIDSVSHLSQIIICTQSPELISCFHPEDIIVTERVLTDNGFYETIFKRLSKTELSDWLEEYTLGELWKKNIIGGRPF